jgi:hypothetical protein
VRNTLWILGLALLAPVAASAQKAPLVELFGGYSYLRVRGYAAEESLLSPGSGGSQASTFAFPGFGLNGWNGSVTVNATSWLGAEADVSGFYGMPIRTVDRTAVTLGMHEYNYLAGPRFTYRQGRWAPFAHALFGKAHASVLIGAPEILQPISDVETKFAMAFGGGVDLRVYRGLAIRLAQGDWLTTSFVGGHQKNIRLSAGIVIGL